MPKQIKADLDQVVEVMMRVIVNGESGYINNLVGQYEEDFLQSISTALEQFVVESNEAVMDSIEKIIGDMEESAIFYDKLLQYETSEAIRHYLTRLKALRESNTKTLLDQVREVMAQKDKSHSQITDEIIKVIEDYEKQFT